MLLALLSSLCKARTNNTSSVLSCRDQHLSALTPQEASGGNIFACQSAYDNMFVPPCTHASCLLTPDQKQL